MASNYFVKLDQFEGPLDLLLHLIRVHELNIMQIDLYILTSQYLDYLRLMRFRDLKDAAAFMEMAAALIEIKSNQLLPHDESPTEDSDSEGLEIDPAADLQKRILDYDTFRKAADYLLNAPKQGQLIAYSRECERLTPNYSHIEAPLRQDPGTLLILYEQMLSTLAERRPVTVQAVTESLSVEEVIEQMRHKVSVERFLMLQSLFPKMETRYEMVANILAFLQLVRDRELKIYQDHMLGPIWLYKTTMAEQDLKKQIEDNHIEKQNVREKQPLEELT